MPTLSEETIGFILEKLRRNEIQVEDLKKEINILRRQDKKRMNNLKEHDQKIEEQKKELKEQKTDSIQYLGLFVAIFTAISIDIQLLKFAQNVWSVAGLMIMVNTAPLFFFWLIRSFTKEYTWKDILKFILVFIALFLIGGTFLYFGTISGYPNTIIEKTKTEKIRTVDSNINEQVTIEKDSQQNTELQVEQQKNAT